jgi:hypothetical protein
MRNLSPPPSPVARACPATSCARRAKGVVTGACGHAEGLGRLWAFEAAGCPHRPLPASLGAAPEVPPHDALAIGAAMPHLRGDGAPRAIPGAPAPRDADPPRPPKDCARCPTPFPSWPS